MHLKYNETLNELTHGYYMKLLQCYRPHTSPDLSGDRVDKISHCNIKSIGEDVDYQWPKPQNSD
jgi:hypothetical protein